MKKYNIGILGATGAVGKQMIEVLQEYNFPINELHLLASSRSKGKEVVVNGQSYIIEEATNDSFKGLDFVLGAASNDVAKQFKDAILKANAVFIDNSSAFRMDDNVPLVVPEINGDDVFKHQGIISNPNCSTIITLVAINAINKLSKITKIVASTYQAVSGAGAQGPIELNNQMQNIINNEPIQCEVFPYQIAQNVIPQIGSFLDSGYTTEEMKMQNEGRKILHNKDLLVSCTCVRVPVERSHSISALVVTENQLDIETVKSAISKEKGCVLYDEPQTKKYPMPILTSNQDQVFVGRIRKSIVNLNGIELWCSGDQVRKGAASNAVQIMMKLVGLLD